MEKLLEWLKANVKDDADMNEATALIDGYAEVTTERAKELLREPEMRRVFDAEVSRAVENHDERFKAEKLPKILEEERGKIQKELNPDETPEQKRIRELEERIAKADRDRETVERRETLRKKAQELGIADIGLTPDDVEPFVSLGESAEETLESFINRSKEAWTASLDSKLKEQYKGKAPEGTPETETDDGLHGEEYVQSRLKDSFLN